jgi:hypothetical protein
LLYGKKDRITILALNRPKAMNAITRELVPARGRHQRLARRDFDGKKSGRKRKCLVALLKLSLQDFPTGLLAAEWSI